MSLLSRVWLSVVLAMMLALCGSLMLSVLTARDYLAQQLFSQASDSATSLALSMSQQSKDVATSELLVSALFDAGHFEFILFRDVSGKVLVERRSSAPVLAVPSWFVKLVPLEARTGEALVSDGWKQAGSVSVKASPRFAYVALWKGALKQAATQLAIGVMLGGLLTILLRWAWAPLRAIVRQAVAIGQRHFITLPEPVVPELRVVGRAMNAMVERVQALFAEQTERINTLRDEANHDAMTGLPNRGMFVAQLKGMLLDDDKVAEGGVLVLRLLDLAGINRRLGRERADALISAAASLLRGIQAEEGIFAGRLNGADFALIVEGADKEGLQVLGHKLLEIFADLYRQTLSDREQPVAIGATCFRDGESSGAVLLRADNALMQAESMGPQLVVSLGLTDTAQPQLAQDWREELDHALAVRAFDLAAYPVVRADAQNLHQEVMLRLRNRQGQTLSAGQFMPAVMRQQRTAEFDLVSIELALEKAEREQRDVAVNISPLSLASEGFIRTFGEKLLQAQGGAARLWVEISEKGLDSANGFSDLERLADVLALYKARLGIEHFGQHFSALPRLYALELDYIKLDGAFVAGIDLHPGNQRFVKAVLDVAHSMSIEVIAERVTTREEWDTLASLGVDGVTGPCVTAALKAG